MVRKLGRPVVLVANKIDNARRERELHELYELGFGEPIPVSALHGRGTGDLLDVLTKDFPQQEGETPGEAAIAIVGRPNVGKSTLFNRVVGSERSIVHAEAGTTRDAVDTVIEVDGETFRFVDTAGLRRQARVDGSTEYYGSVRTMRALDRCDIAVLVIDVSAGVSRQDLRIAEDIAELGRSAVIVLNKVDLADADHVRIEREELARRVPHLEFAPVLEVSALSGRGVDKLLPALGPILEARRMRIPTHLLNAVVTDLQARTPIPSTGRGQRVKYAVQVEIEPPTIVLFGTDRIPERWRRYLERGLRSRFGFEGTPIRLVTRGQTRRDAARRRPAHRSGSAHRSGRTS
jgi:GTP-binding protein